MISKCELVFFSHFRMNANVGTCWSRLFLAHFTTLFRMVTKISVKQILFPWLVQGKILDTWTAFCSLFCMPKPLPNVGVLLACFLTDTQISNSWIGIQTWPFEYKYNVQCFWLKRILNIIIQAGIFREYWNKCFWRPKSQVGIFREYRNKCFWRPECFGKGTTSDYAIADIKWEGSSSDYAVSEIRWEIPFFSSVLHA